MATLFETICKPVEAPLSPRRHHRGRPGQGRSGLHHQRPDRRRPHRPPAARACELIAQFGNGFDNIDIEAAYAAGLTVTNTPVGPHRGHRRHGGDADAGAAAPAGRRRSGTAARPVTWPGWSPTSMLGPTAARQGARHCRHGPHRHRRRGASGASGSTSTISPATAARRRVEDALGATFWASARRAWSERWISFRCTRRSPRDPPHPHRRAARPGCGRTPTW